MLPFGSLFSGFGGIDLGLERAGWTCKWQVEIDPFCRKVLEKHWPHVLRYGDIKELTGNELTRVYLLAGGFPCQDLSLAGRGAGLAGERSGLWFEYLRIICALRPRWVLVENVPGLFIRGIDTVLGGLAEAGYDATWFSLQAADFGVPHKRERVIVLAHTTINGWGEVGAREPASPNKNVGHSQCPEWWPGESAGYESYRENAGWQKASGGIGTSGTDGGKGFMGNAERKGWTRSNGIQKSTLTSKSGEDVADSEGFPERGLPFRKREEKPRPDFGGKDMANAAARDYRSGKGRKENGHTPAITGSGGRSTESLLGRVFDGFSGGMERYRWPAGKGQEQYDWEPPRVATGIKNRVPRLKGLGNAVVPAMAELIGWIIREIEEGVA